MSKLLLTLTDKLLANYEWYRKATGGRWYKIQTWLSFTAHWSRSNTTQGIDKIESHDY